MVDLLAASDSVGGRRTQPYPAIAMPHAPMPPAHPPSLFCLGLHSAADVRHAIRLARKMAGYGHRRWDLVDTFDTRLDEGDGS